MCQGGPATYTVSCNPGERATGGGWAQIGSDAISANESRPNPTSGPPTGWTVTATYSNGARATSTTSVQYQLYVACSAP
jgi:hypothetical protein